MTLPPKTSANNPLQIATIAAGGGHLGVTFAPGKHQDGVSGRHERDLATDLDAIAAWNAALVLTLVEPKELDELAIAAIGPEVRRRHMEWHHWPIPDFGVPDAAFMAAWPARAAMLVGLLARGGRVLIHCKGGLGRAGMVAARLMVETSRTPADAIATVRAARPGAVETPEQERWVAAPPTVVPAPAADDAAAKDRAVGALLGLAVGDALGAAIEFEPKPRYARLTDLEAGGPHRLARGQWTDDTAMALALADSLLHDPALDPADLMRRFVSWSETGAYSCTGTCFDIGIQTRTALRRFTQTGDPIAGSTESGASGNGALMRLSPVAIAHWRDRPELQRVAALQTRTTHGSPATLAASDLFADMLADAIAGVPLSTILSGPAAARIEGGWRDLHRDAIEGKGYVVRSLQAAVWAVARTTDFRSAVLLAANLGDDSDTTAAIAGQLAGAIYGAEGIPAEWLQALAWHDRLRRVASGLFDRRASTPKRTGSAAGSGSASKQRPFATLLHADWSKDADKRWLARAERTEAGWIMSAPAPVGNTDLFVESLWSRPSPVLAGFDFPIGLPSTYGKKTGFADFLTMMPAFGTGYWEDFFSVAQTPDQISFIRPFYPKAGGEKGQVSQEYLTKALKVGNMDDLLRICERKTPSHPAACCLFWTLGANQVGKGAITGWKEVIIPARKAGARLWPFDGPLEELAGEAPVLAETYPAEAYGHVGIKFARGESKTKQPHRAKAMQGLGGWAEKNGVKFEQPLEEEITDGFGPHATGEDRFDALIGLLGMIEVMDGRRPAHPPGKPVDPWEGWIMGQASD